MDARLIRAFHPFERLAAVLLPAAANDDPSHDESHLARVWANASAILAGEGGDAEIVAAAVLLHDCVPIEKDSPLRSQASRLAGAKAALELRKLGWAEERICRVVHAVEAHSFSAKIEPVTLEAKIVQDADRLDSLGAMGVARTFFVAGRIGRQLYHPTDPTAANRPLDDVAFSTDHFRTKLLRLADGFKTKTGATLAVDRSERVRRFLAEFEEEAGVTADAQPASIAV